jgi:uncharacterized membrane protein YfcA
MDEHSMLAVVLGAVIGGVLAMTGAGGGILAIPVLVFGLGLSMTQAAPVGLLAVALASGVGAVLGLKQGVVRYKAAAFISSIGIVAAPLGLHLAQRIPNKPLALVFSLVLVYASVRMLRNASREIRNGVATPRREVLPCVLNPATGRLRWTLPCARVLALTGFTSGLLSGLLGVGGGFVIIPALTRYTNLEMKSIVATSLAVIASVSIGGVIAAAISGVMYWQAAVPFAAGAVLGLIAGRQLAHKLAIPRLQQAFSIVGIVAAIMLGASVFDLGLGS